MLPEVFISVMVVFMLCGIFFIVFGQRFMTIISMIILGFAGLLLGNKIVMATAEPSSATIIFSLVCAFFFAIFALLFKRTSKFIISIAFILGSLYFLFNAVMGYMPDTYVLFALLLVSVLLSALFQKYAKSSFPIALTSLIGSIVLLSSGILLFFIGTGLAGISEYLSAFVAFLMANMLYTGIAFVICSIIGIVVQLLFTSDTKPYANYEVKH